MIQGGVGRGCARSVDGWDVQRGPGRSLAGRLGGCGCRRAGNRRQRTDPRWTALGGAGRAGGLGVADPDVCPDRSFPVGRAGDAEVVAGAAEPCQLWRHEMLPVMFGRDRLVASDTLRLEASPGPS